MDDTPRINWWPPAAVAVVVAVGLIVGWDQALYAIGVLGVIGALLLVYDGIAWLRRRP